MCYDIFSRDMPTLVGLSLGWSLFCVFHRFWFFFASLPKILSLKLNNVKINFFSILAIISKVFIFSCGYQRKWEICGDDDIVVYTYECIILSRYQAELFSAGFFFAPSLRCDDDDDEKSLNNMHTFATSLCLNYNFMFEILLQGSLARRRCHLLAFAEFKLHHRKFTRI
jgi:hypothetical protein